MIPGLNRSALEWLRRTAAWLMLVMLNVLLTAQSGRPAPAIGRLLSSDPVSIEGRATWTSPKEDFEDPTPLVFSGTKITIQAGIALLQMEDSSGVAGFCGRTSLSLLKSQNTLLYAMNSGTLSLDLSSPTTDRVLTPDLAVEWKSIAAGRKQGVVSLDSRGGLCVQNFAGSVKISDLLNGQSLDLPAGSSVQLQSGQASTARISKGLDCGCTKSVPMSAAVTPLTAKQPPPVMPSPEPASTPPPDQAVPTQEKLPSALTTATDENNRPPQQPLGNTVRQQARVIERQDSQVRPAVPSLVAANPAPARIDPPPSASLPAASLAPTSPPPAQNKAPAPEAGPARDSTGTAPVMSATMAVSAETLPKPARRNSFGQKVKNFFRTMFFMKKKAPPPDSASASN
ncbi:MAG: hypothetical protein LAO31_04760 [Acidobacteriia bacterium]|nr:hypothetical protein [Terriglobia bacterium]